MIWNVLLVVGLAALGLFGGMVAGFVYTVSVGGIGPDDPRQYVVSAMVMVGLFVGLVIGSLVVWLR